MKNTKRIVIQGHVQGVYFRESLRQLAQRAGVTGWVRNRRDGSVEAVLQGAPEVVNELIEWARHGPPGARVAQLEVFDDAGDYIDFQRLPTL